MPGNVLWIRMRTVPPVKAVPSYSVEKSPLLLRAWFWLGRLIKTKVLAVSFCIYYPNFYFCCVITVLRLEASHITVVVFSLGQMEKQGASADIFLSWN